MHQQTSYQAQPVAPSIGEQGDPGMTTGVVLALVVALLVIRYLKAILLLLAAVVVITLALGAGEMEVLVEDLVRALRSDP